MITLDFLIILACAAGACTDLAFKRIPNALTIATALIALGIHAASGFPSLALSLATLILTGAAGFFLFNLRLIGGGDVKLIAAIAAALSFPACLGFLLYTMVAGGVLALVVATARGTFKASVSSVTAAAAPVFNGGAFSMPATTTKIPYGVAIFCGAILSVLSTAGLPFLRLPF